MKVAPTFLGPSQHGLCACPRLTSMDKTTRQPNFASCVKIDGLSAWLLKNQIRATCSRCPRQGVGVRWFLRSLPDQIIPQFCGHIRQMWPSLWRWGKGLSKRGPSQAINAAFTRRIYPFKLRAWSNEDVVISPLLIYFWSSVLLTHCFLRERGENVTFWSGAFLELHISWKMAFRAGERQINSLLSPLNASRLGGKTEIWLGVLSFPPYRRKKHKERESERWETVDFSMQAKAKGAVPWSRVRKQGRRWRIFPSKPEKK